MKLSVIEHTIVGLVGVSTDILQDKEIRLRALDILETVFTDDNFLSKIENEPVKTQNNLNPLAKTFVPEEKHKNNQEFPKETIDYLIKLADGLL